VRDRRGALKFQADTVVEKVVSANRECHESAAGSVWNPNTCDHFEDAACGQVQLS
jgi:hypothetical protein